ncbi:Tad domain-containing protein [Variovorax paradoxus]|nr:Tad domain-containing protein [Variovorax paradoxus]
MKVHTSGHRQSGAMIITVALALLFLLGFMGIALDFGHLFVVKTELQTAMDSCALAAAQELDRADDALTRATNAGTISGNLNKINFQGETAGIVAADITFSDTLTGSYSHTFTPVANAKYAKCMRTKSGMLPWLLQTMGAASGNAALGATQSVAALAVASRAPSQTNCAIPVGLCRKAPIYQPGEWLAGAVGSNDAVTGQFRWLDFTANGGGAKELKDVLKGEGQCALPGSNTVAGKPGNNGSAAFAYNTRFGIFQGSGGPPTDGIPDLTGYAWYSNTTLAQPPYPNKYPQFLAKRAINAPYQGETPPDTTGLPKIGGKTYSGSLSAVGADRRIVVAPVINCEDFDKLAGGTLKIDSMACILLLHPIKGGAGPGQKMWVEYLGQADSPTSPCSTIGLVGGLGGPFVPALVQ